MTTTTKKDAAVIPALPDYFATMEKLKPEVSDKAAIVAILANLSAVLTQRKTVMAEAMSTLPEHKAFLEAKEALDKAAATLPSKVDVDFLNQMIGQFVQGARMARTDCADLEPPTAPVGRPKGSTNKPKP